LGSFLEARCLCGELQGGRMAVELDAGPLAGGRRRKAFFEKGGPKKKPFFLPGGGANPPGHEAGVTEQGRLRSR